MESASNVSTCEGDPSPPVRVFVIDDHGPFRSAVAEVLGPTSGFVLVGSAGTGEEALAKLETSLTVDLLLADFTLPGIDGVETVERYRRSGGTAIAILLSTTDERDLPRDIGHRGIDTFLPKASFSKVALTHAWAGAVANSRC